MEYIDIHTHVNFKDFDDDREEVFSRAQGAGVAMINVGTKLATSKQAVELAETHPNTYAIVGLHPIHTCGGEPGEEEIKGENFDEEGFRELLKHPKVVGLGECGLDFFRNNKDTREVQEEVFRKHLTLAEETDTPVMLHIRDAYNEALEVLSEFPNVRGNVHFFAGDIPTAQKFLEKGFTLSFTGVITFAKEYEELVQFVPLNRIHAETDAPYVTPVPNRGKRNEPVFVRDVVAKIAEIKELPVEEVKEQLLQNAKNLFGI
jgi:TatD DNase family protein